MSAAPAKVFAYDGHLARLLLTVLGGFAVSAQFVLAALPALAVDAASPAVSHGSIWLGALAALPIGPAAYAALAGTRDMITERGYAGAPLRRFRRAFAAGAVRLWWLWTGLALMQVLLAYDSALYGAGDGAFLAVTAAALLLGLASIAVCCTVLGGAEGPPLRVLTVAVQAAVVRPLAPFAWTVALLAAGAAVAIPLVGPSLALFAPAGCAWAILTANAATGFDRKAAVDA